MEEPQNFHLYPGDVRTYLKERPLAAQLALKGGAALNVAELKNVDNADQRFKIYVGRPEHPPRGWTKADIFVLVVVPAGQSVEVPKAWIAATHLVKHGNRSCGWSPGIEGEIVGGHAPRLRIIVDGVDVTPPMNADLLRNVRPPSMKPQRRRRLRATEASND